MEDQRGRLTEDVFSYRITKDHKALIYWHNKLVMTLKDDKARKFMTRIDGLSSHEAQLVMAKITGNFKRGNERHRSRE